MGRAAAVIPRSSSSTLSRRYWDDARLDLPLMRDNERTIAHLRETSPQAFHLGVIFQVPFTIPVARLIQDTMFGPSRASKSFGRAIPKRACRRQNAKRRKIMRRIHSISIFDRKRAPLLTVPARVDAQRTAQELVKCVSNTSKRFIPEIRSISKA